MDATTEILVVDRRTGGPWSPLYRLASRCQNCNGLHVAEFTKGDTPKGPHGNALTLRCPHCECAGFLIFGHKDEAAQWLDGKTPVHVQEMEGGFFPAFTGLETPEPSFSPE